MSTRFRPSRSPAWWAGRILLGILALALVLVLLLAASVVIDGMAAAGRMDEFANTTIPGSPDVRAYVARPQGSGPFPTVIMIHEFYGLNESITGKADGLAAEGYLVVAPDTFRGSTTRWIPRAIYQVITTPSDQINQDLDQVFNWLEAQPEADPDRIAVMGFCYGGRASLSYSLHNPGIAATAVFYGSPETDPDVLRSLPGPVLGIFGGADASIPLEDVYAFKAGLDDAGIPNEISVYDGQPHAFVTSMEEIRAGGAQGQAWSQLLRFLDASLRQSPSSGVRGTPAAHGLPLDLNYYLRLTYEHARMDAGAAARYGH